MNGTCRKIGIGSIVVLCTSVLLMSGGCDGANAKGQEGHNRGSSVRKPEHWAFQDAMHLYLCAFHVAKENPKLQVIAHHYCSQHGRSVHQCVIYDSLGTNSKLLGVEYIIDDATYRTLSDDEKKYWHPHAYEIISGQLIAPDLPKEGDDIFPGLITTWGKTWHTWRDPASALPLGEPLLMWSANGDGQVDDALISQRDGLFGMSTTQIRERRKAFGFAMPNVGPPKSIEVIGRQWTANGPDRPSVLADSKNSESAMTRPSSLERP
jgi:hypothetical protein